jgi:glycosyl transferase family 92
MHYLAACAIYRDEAPFLAEWIEFHRLVGVEKLFLYDNLSTDGHREVLAPYLDDGTVVLTEWPEVPGQGSAYLDCLERRRDEARWIAFIDIDEFLFSPTLAPVPEILVDYERWPAVYVNWAVFGPSGHERPPARLLLESYTHRAPDHHPLNRMCKCVVDPRRTARIGAGLSVHSFDHTEGHAVDENFQPRDKRPRGQTEKCSFARLRVNHYYMKSKEEWFAKMTARKADTGEARGYKPEGYDRMASLFSEVHDETIQAYLPALEAALAARGQPSAGAAAKPFPSGSLG